MKSEKGETKGIVSVIRDITERKQAEEVLRKTREQLREAHRLALIGIWNWIADTDTVTWTEELYRIAGLDPMIPAPTYAEDLNLYAPESWARLKVAVEKAIETGAPYQLELELIRPDGSTRWVNAFGGPIYDDHGEVKELHGTVQDITERKLQEEKIKASLLEKETLLKEIHYRVKNNLAVISSLLGLQSSYLEDEKSREIFQESQDRIRVMANIHTLLYQSEDLSRVDFGGFIRDLAGRLQQSYGTATPPIEIQVDIADISLTIETSIPCGLILNELISNALKHAFPEELFKVQSSE